MEATISDSYSAILAPRPLGRQILGIDDPGRLA
jgi:hypothetical protein